MSMGRESFSAAMNFPAVYFSHSGIAYKITKF